MQTLNELMDIASKLEIGMVTMFFSVQDNSATAKWQWMDYKNAIRSFKATIQRGESTEKLFKAREQVIKMIKDNKHE